MSEKYKREIEDILQRAGELGAGGRRRRPRRGFVGLIWTRLVQSVGGKTWSLSPGRVMLAGLVVLLAAWLVGSTPATFLGFAGLLLLIVGYAMFFVRPPKVEKRWRQRPIDYGRNNWWDRLRRRIK